MCPTKNMLALDFGGSNGRAILAVWDGRRMSFKTMHRFPVDAVEAGGTLYFDALGMLHQIKQGLLACKNAGIAPNTIGIATWGETFGLLDADGDLLINILHYRHALPRECLDEASRLIPDTALFESTGLRMQTTKPLFQLYYLASRKPYIMSAAKRYLNTPDLMNYFLTGIAHNELTIISSTQTYDVIRRGYALGNLEKIGVNPKLFCDPVLPGTSLGCLKPELAKELGMDVQVVAVAEHDTASAIATIPTEDEDCIFISSGTFSAMGIELDHALASKDVFDKGFTQEMGATGRVHLKKNLTGLWILQECRRTWKTQGIDYSYDDMQRLSAQAAGNWQIDTTDPRFAMRCDMPEVIRAYCLETQGNAPQSHGEIILCIEQSLARTYERVVMELESITGKRYARIYMVGGGVRNKHICNLTAQYTGKEVMTGAAEATVIGNICMQMAALGITKTITQARQILNHCSEAF